MRFINNWRQAVTLSAGAASLALALPDGEYRLTLTDAGATRWEIIGAEVAAGVAALMRGLEGTAVQEWPAGSAIYCGITAGGLQALQTGGSVVVGTAFPVDAPTAPGLLYVYGDAAWIATGDQHPEQWAQLIGPRNDTGAAVPADIAVDRMVRQIYLSAHGHPGPDVPLSTLQFPAWPVAPDGLQIEVGGIEEGVTVALDLDFSALGDDCRFDIELPLIGVTASRAGAVLSLLITQDVRINSTFLILQVDEDEHVSGVNTGLRVTATPAVLTL